MIVPMKKVYLIVQKKDAVSALENLRDLEVVHVEHQESLEGYQLAERREQVDVLKNAIDLIKSYSGEEEVKQMDFPDWTELVNQTLKDAADIENKKEFIAKRQVVINQWEAWGDFNPKHIEELEEQGIYIKLIQKSKKENNQSKDLICEPIYSAGSTDFCVVISENKDVEIPYEVIELPPVSLKIMYTLQRKQTREIVQLENKIKNNACFVKSLEKTLKEREDVLNFEEVEQGMKDEEELTVLKGFCPEARCEDLEKEAKVHKWGILIQDPAKDDDVPTLLKNPAWVNLSKPALQVIEILPGYKEVDVSMVFIVFFTLFFGMLIGDAAYGAIFGLLTMIAHIKMGKKVGDKTAFFLLYLLTGFTVLWGVMTGTYFGQSWLPEGVQPVVPWLNEIENLTWLCFTIALAHLSIARIWSFVKQLPQLTAVSELGWLLVVWGMYFLANKLVLGMAFPDFALWLLLGGIGLALFFMVPFKDFLKKVPMEIIPFVLGVIGAGTDIISYIRLFAVGLATVKVADAANIMPDVLPYGIGYAFMVFLHVLNMVLAAMAILVHAVRLNVLEFSGHLSLEWSGFEYSPFKRVQHA